MSAREAQSEGSGALALIADVARRIADAMVARALSEFGRIDI